MSSDDPLIISGMLEANKMMEASVHAYLVRLIADREAHAKFMNMLSMLEHMGSRKIMVSQMHKQETLTEDTLKHLAEEARHAYFFKRQAERAAGHALDGWTEENTTARVPALMYFGRMDAGISKEVGDDLAYYWVSLIIELRACWLYRIYQEALEASDYQLSLKSLIAEEDGHLEEMFGACGADTQRLRALSTYETELFKKLWAQIDDSSENSVEMGQAA
ncbi:MAG: hypothetical protein LRY62_01235 [Alphaproteobacteria bacterium]|nr:hypothetical protein [Alphaproteobacteria bacterium]